MYEIDELRGAFSVTGAQTAVTPRAAIVLEDLDHAGDGVALFTVCVADVAPAVAHAA